MGEAAPRPWPVAPSPHRPAHPALLRPPRSQTPGALNTSEQRALWGLMTVAGSEFRCKEEKKSPWGGPNAFGPERNPGRELLPPFQGRASPLTVALLPHARRLRPVWEHGPFSGLPKSQGACGCRGA